MARSWLSAQQWIFGVSSHYIAGYSHCSPNSRYLECPVGEWSFVHPMTDFSWLPIGYPWYPSLIKLSQSSASIVAHCPWWRKYIQNIWGFWKKLPSPWDSLMLLPPAPRSSQPTDKVTISTNLSCCSSPWDGEEHQIALSLGGGDSWWGGLPQLLVHQSGWPTLD